MNRAPVVAALSFSLLASRAPSQSSVPARSLWQVVTAGQPPAVMLNLNSLKPVTGPGLEVRPVLSLRCRQNQLAIFVATGLVLQSDDNVMSPVTITFGSTAATAARWSRSTDFTAVFAPDPFAFMQQLLANPDLRFEIHPADAEPTVIGFDARGLERHLWAIQTSCPLVPEERLGAADSALASDSGGTPVFREAVVEEAPALVNGPPLAYPDHLRRAGIQGRVIVRCIVDSTGRAEPRSVQVLQSTDAGFTGPAMDFVLAARFRPARVKGRPVRVLLRIPIEFRIRRGR